MDWFSIGGKALARVIVVSVIVWLLSSWITCAYRFLSKHWVPNPNICHASARLYTSTENVSKRCFSGSLPIGPRLALWHRFYHLRIRCLGRSFDHLGTNLRTLTLVSLISQILIFHVACVDASGLLCTVICFVSGVKVEFWRRLFIELTVQIRRLALKHGWLFSVEFIRFAFNLNLMFWTNNDLKHGYFRM